MSEKPIFLHGLFLPELTDIVKSLNQPAYRASQIWDWLYRKYAIEWDDMKNIPAELRSFLGDKVRIKSVVDDPAVTFDSRTTLKLLAGLDDGDAVEEVIIPSKERRTVCVSCQVGCKFKFAFCASGQAGFRRNLDTGEIVGQVVAAARLIGGKPSNIVFMGMGEPFDNYDAVIKAARIMNDKDGINIGARHITISTCGVIPGIKRLATEGIQFELSVSLHAANDAARSRLMPVNQRYPLSELMQVCKEYTDATNRIITFEYTLIEGVNDREADAKQLVKLLRPLMCRVNLLTLNSVPEFSGRPPDTDRIYQFRGILHTAGINTTLRESKGSKDNAACGQLRFGSKASA